VGQKIQIPGYSSSHIYSLKVNSFAALPQLFSIILYKNTAGQDEPFFTYVVLKIRGNDAEGQGKYLK